MAKIDFNFEKSTISKGILDFLSEKLVEDPDTNWDVVKKNLKESFAVIAKGNKLDYGSANNLLLGVLRALNLEDSSVEDEIALAVSQSADDFDSLPSQLPPASRTPTTEGSPKAKKIAPNFVESGSSNLTLPTDGKKEVCRFFARGHCNRSKDCRFYHPRICNKFRQHGSTSTDPKGCDGKCNAFHPNACRQSLREKTCSFQDCRFFHLKGTKRTSSTNNESSNNHWHSNQHTSDRNGQKNQSQSHSRQNFESKNRFAGLSKKAQKRGENPTLRPTPQPPITDTVSQQEKVQLAQTLEAIMKRLTTMESKQSSYPQFQPVQPLLSPAVPQLGSQTQQQHQLWASQPHWPQTPSQY